MTNIPPPEAKAVRICASSKVLKVIEISSGILDHAILLVRADPLWRMLEHGQVFLANKAFRQRIGFVLARWNIAQVTTMVANHVEPQAHVLGSLRGNSGFRDA